MLTNFAALTPKQKLVWSRDVWQAARDQMFIKRFLGTSENSMIQRITELTKTEKGDQCLIQLVADLVEDGVIGDNEREGNEEAMQAFSQIITLDLITHSVRNKGKLSEQRTTIKFRESAKSRLSYWLANRCDQLSFLSISGISYAFQNNGAPRVGSSFPGLAFAADVTAPSAKRSLMWDGTSLAVSNTGSITSAYVISYKTIVDLIAYAKEHYVKPLMEGGREYYVFLLAPGSLAQLKKDPDYQRAVVATA
ncbi:phage capsid family protein, partial [Simplicispira piscis]